MITLISLTVYLKCRWDVIQDCSLPKKKTTKVFEKDDIPLDLRSESVNTDGARKFRLQKFRRRKFRRKHISL